MPQELRAGTLADWGIGGADSMAKDIEAALQAEFGPFPPSDPTTRRKLCVAIARGVIAHLEKNPQAFKVRTTTGTDRYGTVYDIATA